MDGEVIGRLEASTLHSQNFKIIIPPSTLISCSILRICTAEEVAGIFSHLIPLHSGICVLSHTRDCKAMVNLLLLKLGLV